MKYAFILGREAALSTAEIIARFQTEGIEFDQKGSVFSKSVFIAELDKEIGPEFFHTLGGSIKLVKITGKSENIDKDILESMQDKGENKLTFGISVYNCGGPERKYFGILKWLKPLSLEIKKKLKSSGRPIRVVIAEKGELSSVQVDKNGLVTEKGFEHIVLLTKEETLLGKTIAVQAFEKFSDMDYGRPGRDSRSGMLPPKLARMMINLSKATKDELLVDPFCGSGTILTEAILLGHQKLLGTDISEKAIIDTKKNYEWIITQENLRGIRFTAYKKDVKSLSDKVEPESVDAIVTEPFLGPPLRGRESDQQIHKIFLEIMDLYRAAFKTFSKILKPGGTVVFVFPFFGNKHVNILREIQEMGFKPEGLLPAKAVEALEAKSSTGLIYKRPDQKVGRDIFRFRFTK